MCKQIKILIIIVIILLLIYYFYENNNKEHYVSKSSGYDVSQGSSMKYGWGYPEDQPTQKKNQNHFHHHIVRLIQFVHQHQNQMIIIVNLIMTENVVLHNVKFVILH